MAADKVEAYLLVDQWLVACHPLRFNFKRYNTQLISNNKTSYKPVYLCNVKTQCALTPLHAFLCKYYTFKTLCFVWKYH